MKRLCIALALVALAACGGGGPETAPAAPTPVELSAADAANRAAAAALAPAGASVAALLVEGETGFVVFQEGASATAAVLSFAGGANVTSQIGPVPIARSLTGALSPEARFDSAAEAANRATIEQFYRAVSSRDTAVVGALVAPNYVDHTVSDTPDGGAALLGALSDPAAPALALGPVAVVTQGDLVAAQVSVGVGAPPAFSPGADIFRIEAGKIVERWRINY